MRYLCTSSRRSLAAFYDVFSSLSTSFCDDFDDFGSMFVFGMVDSDLDAFD